MPKNHAGGVRGGRKFPGRPQIAADWSLCSDAELFDDLAPLVRIGTRQCREFFGTRFGRLDRNVLHPLLHLGQEQNTANLALNLLAEPGTIGAQAQ